MKTLAAALLLWTATGFGADRAPYADRPLSTRVAYTEAAVLANLTPLSAVYAPRCLPGYILCKLGFAGASLLAAADQLAISGGGDRGQTRAILYRGFSGDWLITPRHIAGEATPEPLPDPPASESEGGGHGGFEPPPI